ncbi:MAG: potassium channel protein [Rhodothermales bacterium]|nr:potassium channel protein [Rhodothermales bacterium]
MAMLLSFTRPLVSWLTRAEPTKREIILATFFLAALLGTGTLGYSLIEGWYWLDGLYMTFITLTTIGFAEVNTLSDLGRIFTIGIGIVGIGAVAFIATRAAQLLLTSEVISKRHMNKRISQLEDHYIICGYGRIGKRVAQDLRKANKPFVVVEISPAKIEGLIEDDFLYILGNAENEEALEDAGISRSRGLILTLPEDSANVFVTLTAREMNPGLFILARTDTHQNERKLRRAGADKVVAAYEIGADRMAQVILRPNVDRFVEDVLQSDGLDLIMEEVQVQEGSLMAGHSLAESNFRQKFNTIVVAILTSQTDEMLFNPSATSVISPGDILIVLGSQDMIDRLRNEGCS